MNTKIIPLPIPKEKANRGNENLEDVYLEMKELDKILDQFISKDIGPAKFAVKP